PPTDHVLWVAAPSRGSTASRFVDWAAEGGHLVVIPSGSWGEDSLLQALRAQRFGEAGADEDDHESRPRFASSRPDWPLLYALEGAEVLDAEGASDAAWSLTMRVGIGTATILATGAFLHNEAIGQQDHALIAWQAALPESEPAGLWLLYRDPGPSVWSLLTDRTRPIVISLLCLVVAALMLATRRFGPLHESSPKHRRQLAEHVRASGTFLWKIGCETALLQAARRALGRRLSRGVRPTDRELELLAWRSPAAARLDEEAMQTALSVWETRDRQEFTRTIQILEALRRS
ncbi:MAG: DUF4350 domain-containing protein, partial [Acidobacteriota bacterium]